MKHHFADLLDRSDDYWTIVPNRERYAYSAMDKLAEKDLVKILTISKHDENWKQAFDCPNLEELTLNDPSKEQLAAIHTFRAIKRMRVSYLRTPTIDFIAHCPNVEELVMEYVSGFSDLAPLQELKQLKSLHLENLRRVSSFDGLRGIESLRYLFIGGTLDWNQPIADFNFFASLPNLEAFQFMFVFNQSPFPAFLPLLYLKKLKKIHVGRGYFKTPEYAFLKAAFPHIEGCDWELCWKHSGKLEFLGKRAGFVKENTPNTEKRCAEFKEIFEEMTREAERRIKEWREKEGK
ncbi:MAG TPA: hypothetical protein VL727_19400 [Puia sp.]|nr:hypothetical protein [Puia sp.]